MVGVPLIDHYFYKTTKLLRHFKGICVWDWDMNLDCKQIGVLRKDTKHIIGLNAFYSAKFYSQTFVKNP